MTGIVYYPKDNGSEPFKVEVTDNRVKIFVLQCKDSDTYSSEANYEYEYQKIFIGSDGYFRGNSIIFKTGDRWIYVGKNIYSFRPKAEIIEYVSTVGNSCVPYPFAIDVEGRYYMMIEDTIIENLEKNKSHVRQRGDVYHYFYFTLLPIYKDERSEQKKTYLENFRGISKFYECDPNTQEMTHMTLNCTFDPEKQYRHLRTKYEYSDDEEIETLDYYTLKVETINGEIRDLGYTEFREIMKDYAQQVGLSKFEKELIEN